MYSSRLRQCCRRAGDYRSDRAECDGSERGQEDRLCGGTKSKGTVNEGVVRLMVHTRGSVTDPITSV